MFWNNRRLIGGCLYSLVLARGLFLKRFPPLMLTHSGEKPFVCTQCSYSSTTAGNLTVHLLTHSGEKPFICTKCNYCCTTAGSLKTHLLSFGRKTFQLHTVWILLHNSILPQETHVDAFRGEAFQVWPVQLFMRSSYSQEPQAHPHCHLYVSSAASLPVAPVVWSITCFHTPARNLLPASNATTPAKSQSSWRTTWESTVPKRTYKMQTTFNMANIICIIILPNAHF